MLGRVRGTGSDSAATLRLIHGGCAGGEPTAREPLDDLDDDRTSEGRLAADIAAVLAHATDEVLSTAPLTLPLALSVCMARHETGADGLIWAMHTLRAALLAVSGLDPSEEPVPLVCGEPTTAALSLAEYLRGLLARAASACAAKPEAMAIAAAAWLA